MPWIPRPFDYYGRATNQILEDLEQANDNFEILGKCFVNDDPTTGKAKEADTVDGFHASQTPAPNTIPVAGPDGKIASEWLNLGSIGSFTASTTPSANQIPVLDANAILNLINTPAIITKDYTFRRVDLTNATEDYPLAVGEEAIYRTTAKMPLHIQTQDGTVYMLVMRGQGAYLYPNNTSYSKAFYNGYMYCSYKSSGVSKTFTNDDSFVLGVPTEYFGYLLAFIYNFTWLKFIWFVQTSTYIPLGSSTRTDYCFHIGSCFWLDAQTPWTSLGTLHCMFADGIVILVRRLL